MCFLIEIDNELYSMLLNDYIPQKLLLFLFTKKLYLKFSRINGLWWLWLNINDFFIRINHSRSEYRLVGLSADPGDPVDEMSRISGLRNYKLKNTLIKNEKINKRCIYFLNQNWKAPLILDCSMICRAIEKGERGGRRNYLLPFRPSVCCWYFVDAMTSL